MPVSGIETLIKEGQQLLPRLHVEQPLGWDTADAEAGPKQRPDDRAVGVGVAPKPNHVLDARAKVWSVEQSQ